MAFLQSQTMRVHYDEAGAGRDVLVFVHGNFASSRWWRPVLDRLPGGWRGIAIDLRGCGRTESPLRGAASDFSIRHLSLDLGELVDGLGVATFHLVGHSLGAAVAIEFALRRTHRVRSLTLVAPPPASGLAAMRKGHSLFARMLRGIDPADPRSMLALRETWRMQAALGTHRLFLRRALARMIPSASLERAQFDALVDDAARIPPEAIVGFLQALEGWNVERELPSLDVPTLVVAGAEDVLVPPAETERMAQLLGRGERVVWPGVGHSPQLERPDEFARLLTDWAARSRRGRWMRALRRVGTRLMRASSSRPRLAAGA
jgi:3-oxoadipate enol-lactonase